MKKNDRLELIRKMSKKIKLRLREIGKITPK